MTDAAATISGADTDLVAAAKDLVPLVDANAAAAEAQGALTEDVVEALHETGLWAMWVPRELGGGELEPVPSLEVLEALSYGDASAGWVLMAGGLATGMDAAFIGDEAAAALFPPGERLLVHEGQGTRRGPRRHAPTAATG